MCREVSIRLPGVYPPDERSSLLIPACQHPQKLTSVIAGMADRIHNIHIQRRGALDLMPNDDKKA